MNTTNTEKKHYAKRDPESQGIHYINHVSAMTTEGLHAKSAIAAELAHRDIEIERLRAALASPAQAAALVSPSDDGFMAAVNEMDGLYAAPQPAAEALDAARYRWVKEQAEFFPLVMDGTGLLCANAEEAEAEIDAAIAAKQEGAA